MTLDLDAIDKAARSTTPGAWTHDGEGFVDCSNPYHHRVAECRELADAAHIALADPPTVRAMVTEIRRLREALRPFGQVAQKIDARPDTALYRDCCPLRLAPDDHDTYGTTLGDCRHAARILDAP